MRDSLVFYVKSIFATLALPFIGALIIASFYFMMAPSQSMGALEFKFFFLFILFALFSIPTAINNSICYSVSSTLGIKKWWLFIILSGASLAVFYSLLVIDTDFWTSIRRMGAYGFLLGGGSGAVFYWFFMRKKAKQKKNSLDKHPHYVIHLAYLSIMFIVCKLKLANFSPKYQVSADLPIFLAVRPGIGLQSNINSFPPEKSLVLLQDNNIRDGGSYIGERYFDFIFNFAWWLLPGILLIIISIKLLKK